MSSDEEVVSIRKKKHVIHSDASEDENIDHDSSIDRSFSEKEEVSNKATKKKRKTIRLKTFESSSDSDDDNNETSITTDPAKTCSMTLTERFSNVAKSDSSEDESDQSKTTEEISLYKNNDFHEEDNYNKEALSDQSKNKERKKSWYQNSEDLFEEESSGDEIKYSKEDKESDVDEEEMDDTSCSKPLVIPKERASKKKAMNEIQEIRKESQRMVRQTNVSIPYHRPKQRTLEEFRARRKTAPSVSLCTSADKLVSAWKAIEQREKEAETFYKSDTSEDESDSEEIIQNMDVTEQEKYDKLANNLPENSNPNNLEELPLDESKDNDTSKTWPFEDSQESLLKDLDKCIDDSIGKSDLNPDAIEKCDESSVANIVEGVTLSKDSLELKERGKLGTDLKSTESTSRPSLVEKLSDHTNSENEQCSLKGSKSETLAKDEEENSLTSTTAIEVSNHKSLDCDRNVENNMGNTEDFSLKMSESQSEVETSSQQIGTNETPKTKVPAEAGMSNSNENAETTIEVDNYEPEMEFSKLNSDQVLNKVTAISETNTKNKNDAAIYLTSKEKDSFEETLGALNGLSEQKSSKTTISKKYNLNLMNTISDIPKMSVFDCEEIDLDETVAKPEVNNLIERFLIHLSYKKKPVKKKVPLQLSVVSADTDSAGKVNAINKEVVEVLVGEEGEEEDPALAKPGAKLARLKAQLQGEMERQRQLEWEKKQQEQKLYEEEIYEGEKDICDAEEEDEQEQEAVQESEADTSGEEQEEDDEEETDEEEVTCGERKEKSAFIDDEAEESDEDNLVEKDEEESSESIIKRPSHKKIVLKRTKTEDMFLSQEGLKYSTTTEEEDWPSFQKQCLKENVEEAEESDSPVCPSPAFRLTALEGKDTTRANWSAASTPSKDFISPKTVTPVRSRPLISLADKSPSVGSQDLENLCSGTFVTQPTQEVEENNTQDFQLFLADDSQLSQDQETTQTFSTVKTKSVADGKEHMRSLLIDDDDDDITVVNKKSKKLTFSDDEDEHDENNQQSEGDSGESEVEEENIADDPDTAADDVEYDSEENEVVRNAGDFLDKEAELSESEWGSDDEDENGLDILDMEEADKEKIDQRRLQQELGQIHMKQLLIDDKEKVRQLQELLLDDGELHSDSRRRKLFRWSNNLTFGDDNKASMDSDEDKVEEDEDEESWRKERHAREQYLAEHSKKTGSVELAEDECFKSKLFQVGQKALQRLQKSNQTPPTAKAHGPAPSPDPKKPYSLMMTMKRGSLLSRGQQMLSRMAQIVSNSDGPINQPKNGRNFVFASISPTKDKGEKEEIKPLQVNKRKMPLLPLPVAKKPCVQKPKIANKKSLFEALAQVQS